MQIKVGQMQPIEARSGTWGGLSLYAYLFTVTNNRAFVTTDFDKTLIQIKVQLIRNGVIYTIYNSNWLLLGTYKTRKCNFNSFVNGQYILAPTAGTTGIVQLSSWLAFDSPLTLSGNDVLQAEVQWNSMTAAEINLNTSFIDFSFQPSTMREFGIPLTKIEVIATNADTQATVNSSRVKTIHFMTLNRTTLETATITSINLASAQLNYSANYSQLVAAENLKWPENQAYQWTTGNNFAAANINRVNNLLPQCFTIYEGGPARLLLDNCSLNGNFNSANVTASQNWVASTQLVGR